MKKLLVFLLVLALIGVGGWLAYQRFMSPERRACDKLADLCGDKADGDRDDNGDKCVEGMESFKKKIGEEAYGKALTCIDEAESCMGAVGCVVGGGLGGLGQLLKGMVKGLDPKLGERGEELKGRVLEKLKEAEEKLKNDGD